jgi:hypothetical protein
MMEEMYEIQHYCMRITAPFATVTSCHACPDPDLCLPLFELLVAKKNIVKHQWGLL